MAIYLELHDLPGQEVRPLVSGPQTAGLHWADWDTTTSSGSAAASGISFYRLEARSLTDPLRPFVEFRKMVVAR
jgi:hypothetical protein